MCVYTYACANPHKPMYIYIYICRERVLRERKPCVHVGLQKARPHDKGLCIRMNKQTCACVYIYIEHVSHIHTPMPLSLYVYMYIHISTSVCMCMSVCVCMCMHVRTTLHAP